MVFIKLKGRRKKQTNKPFREDLKFELSLLLVN